MPSLSPPSSLLDRIDRKVRHTVPTAWGRLGSLSEVLAQRIHLAGPPILLLSLPRSGSSWVGTVLGAADNALYLREPISQARRANGERATLVKVDATSPPDLIKEVSDRAFAGIPAFPRGVILDAQRWQIQRRHRGRVIIKEVNPLACAFWLQRYQPQVLFLIRHPAAVALSYRKLGWLDNPDVLMAQEGASKSIWERAGLRQGYIHRTVLDSLRDYSDYQIVSYEALCADPIDTFRTLFTFTDLPWDDKATQTVLDHSSGGDRSHTYNTHRHSQALTRSWEGKLEADQLEDLRNGYAHFDLPWYNSPQDW